MRSIYKETVEKAGIEVLPLNCDRAVNNVGRHIVRMQEIPLALTPRDIQDLRIYLRMDEELHEGFGVNAHPPEPPAEYSESMQHV